MERVTLFGTQVFVSPDINREEFERAFVTEFALGEFKFYDLVPDAHNGQKMYELQVPSARTDEVQPWFEEYWRKRGVGTTQEPASGFGWSHGG